MIPIPDRMKHLPLFKGKFPIHFTVFVGPDGEPDFKVVHTENRLKAIQKGWCHICGQPLGKVMVFIGGDSCGRNRIFVDGPMHEECAMYSALACPFLANADYDYSKASPKHTKCDDVKIVTSEMGVTRPARMGMFWTDGFALVDVPGYGLCLYANPFYKENWTIMPERKSS